MKNIILYGIKRKLVFIFFNLKKDKNRPPPLEFF